MLRKITALILSFLLLLTAVGCSTTEPSNSTSQSPQTSDDDAVFETPTVLPKDELVHAALELTILFDGGNYDDIVLLMNAEMAEASPAESLQKLWEAALAQYGTFKKTGGSRAGHTDGYDIVEHTLYFENGSLVQRTVYDADGRVAGLFFRLGEVEEDSNSASENDAASPALPEGTTEKEITFESQDNYTIQGTLTLPKGEAKAAVVLMHGSGPQDRDSTIGANKPFRDIAYALAAQGIATLRYDKVTYTYGEEIAESDDYATFTVDEESVTDAVNAVNWLREQEGIDKDNIFLAGHSLGGGLLAYAGTKGADVAGYISLASSPRKLWEVILDQNEHVLAEAEESGISEEVAKGRETVAAEKGKALRMDEMSDEELLSGTIFGIPGWYLKHLSGIDPIKLHMADEKPVLVLQGGTDRQIFADIDYPLWEDGLADHPDATFHLYEPLNHIFGHYQGEAVPYTRMTDLEYGENTPIPAEVTDDIASWILAHAK